MTALDTGTEDLRAEIDGRVAVITMNRPERRNAMSAAMMTALGAVLARVETDEAVGCVVLTGAGGAFCAGGDVKGMAARPAGQNSDPGRSFDAAIHRQRLSQRATSGRLWSMPKPTIAAIGGPAAGAGLSLALACDLRYAVSGAVLTTAFARVGFAGDYGGTWFLTQLVGSARARELYYFSDRLSAPEAERLGIVNAVFPAEEFEREVMARARRLADGPSIAYRYMKENLNRAVTGELGECMDLEVTHHAHTALTDDHREAAQAFVEKREPRFRGR
ncbi:MAG TPA: enoyl-CoA hydratase-related protein [Streptosporangiaceae bacterium]|nr:enoyl-CoA hydratase-related protein [Streptosporangiaceae bacterium]